jgi:hypothetical protein
VTLVGNTSPSSFHAMTDLRSRTNSDSGAACGQTATWSPQAPHISLGYLLILWLGTAVAVIVSALILPGVSVGTLAPGR